MDELSPTPAALQATAAAESEPSSKPDSGNAALGGIDRMSGASTRSRTPPGGIAAVRNGPPPLPTPSALNAAAKSSTPSKPTAAAASVKQPAPLSGGWRAGENGEVEAVDAGFNSIFTADRLGQSAPGYGGAQAKTLEEGGERDQMAQYSREDVLRRAKLKQSLARTDLSGLDLSNASLEGVDLSRAVLDGANLDGAKLTGAILKNASLRGASLEGADLSQSNCERADFGESKLSRAKLDGASLKRACLEGAELTSASLESTSLAGAELTGATLNQAQLKQADLSHAELGAATLSGADLEGADLDNAMLSGADLSDANLSHALMNDADLTEVSAQRARFCQASLKRASLLRANLRDADLSEADARHANFEGADVSNALLEGARFGKAALVGITAESVRGDVIDVSEQGDGSELVKGARVASFLAGRVEPAASGRRYFGRGDVLRDAVLVFEPNSSVHIDSRFENCSLSLGEGVELTVGESGVLKDCEIRGKGNITIHGRFFERKAPGIVGPRSLVVSARGAMVGAIEQSEESTVFAFQPGCRLRVKILRPAAAPAEPIAAE